MNKLLPQLWDEFPSYRLNERANPDRCRKCWSAIWVLLVIGFKIKLDTTRLNPQQNLNCYLEQIPTFEILKSGQTFVANYRSKNKLVKPTQNIILAEHRCGSSLATGEHPDYWPKPKFTSTDGIPF